MKDIIQLSAELAALRAESFYGDEEDFTPFLEIFTRKMAALYIRRVRKVFNLYRRWIAKRGQK